MTRPSREQVGPLYATEEEIASAVLGPGRLEEWRALAIVWERSGLPRIDAETGRRYYPAVKAWLDRKYGLTTAAPAAIPDGREDWSCPPTKSRRQALHGDPEPMAQIARIGSRPPRR